MTTEEMEITSTTAAKISFICFIYGCILGFSMSDILSNAVLISSDTRTAQISNTMILRSNMLGNNTNVMAKMITPAITWIRKLFSFFQTSTKPAHAFNILFKKFIFITLYCVYIQIFHLLMSVSEQVH